MDLKEHKRQRSPNFPNIGLPEAIEKIEGIYSEQRKSPATREVFARIMGYKGLTGTSAKVVSSLSKYGLLEGSGDDLRISAIGEDLALHKPGDEQFYSASVEAAEKPEFFKELNALYPDGLPSEHATKVFLTKRGFTEQGIKAVLDSYTQTQDLIKSLSTPIKEVKAPAINDGPIIPHTEDAPRTELETGNSSRMMRPTVGEGNTSIDIPISSTMKFVSIVGPFPLSPAEWDTFFKALELYRPILVSDRSDEKESDE